jgi:para-nitrobenzyl esterase
MESSHELAEKVLKQLNLGPSDVSKLQQISFAQLVDAADAATAFKMPASGIIDFRHIGNLLGWAPVAGNAALPTQPFDPTAPEMSASVPMIVGNTLNEFISGTNNPHAFSMTAEQLHTNVSRMWQGKAADEVIATFRTAFPNANNFQLWSTIGASMVRTATLEQVRRKAAQNAAPAYCYRFDWQPPVLNGRPMAFHCSELAFVFDNTARCENMTGDGPAARSLANRMSEAWVHFATSGDPNHAGIPQWKPFDPATNGTMVFDDVCAFREHLDDDCQKVINQA